MTEELTPEELLKIEEEKVITEARKRAILYAKYFSELIISLPEDFAMNQKGLDEVLEPRTEILITKIRENG